ncbi:biotin--[acetyl-CoA-carboxylase] ligase [Aquibacillus rhizosphaerae]|uniref:Bifunctional ligase/repressor BirA n=1 Tax=Aquibacillus rhizosphaerae TaxID=3051431 RepID=A0ABT7L4N4_9BACI|nr:biotin--[acetyl-CoA-carboxylase] ligase [Aquibacillus sp. LR5S19]MDL4840826.1 biotin--[acetyl-CoA-carboxylase] ligase [Aquibacillus sp. LR5S19]
MEVTTRQHLIALLEKNIEDYISGQDLSTKLEISRTAVWKHMKELEKDGYVIEAVPRKGYKIIDFPTKVSANTLQWGLQTNWLGNHFIHRETVDSTQTMALQLASTGAEHGTVVIADEQTAGRGRMQRNWHSQKEQGIWMSLILKPPLLPNQAPQVTLLAATVLADVINDYLKIRPAIKWPNDILINDKKVAGILTEMQAEQDQIQYVVLGIGLNVNQTEAMFPTEIRELATSLKMESKKELNRTELVQKILKTFEQSYERFVNNGFTDIKEKWESYGYKLGESVVITTPKKQWSTVLEGIESDGALRVMNEDGTRQTLYSAEIKW